MKHVKQNYFKDDIRRVFLFYAIVPVVLLTFVCLIIFWGSWRYSLGKTNREDNQRISTDFEATITSYLEVTERLSQQKNIFTDTIDANTRVEIFESVYEVSNRLHRKANLYVFDHDLEPIISATKTLPDFLNGKYYANWGIFRIMNQNTKEVALELIADEDSDAMQLVIGKTVMSDNGILGYIVFVLDNKQFQLEISNLESQTIITNDYRWVYITNNYTFLNDMNRLELEVKKANGTVRNELGKYLITSKDLFEDRIHIYSISPLSNLSSVFWSIIMILFFVFGMMILAVFNSTENMATKKTKDLYTILKAFEKVKQGDLDTYIDISSNDEWAVIGESYNLMLDSLKEQINSNKEMGRLVVTSQAKQLESQFNPHFLYNTLENIRFMCRLDSLSASNMIFNLSTLLRYSISNTQEDVTVKEDVFYTENYMSILKYRFNQRFNYEIDLPILVEQCIIPKLIIQPMIENAIKYGFEGRETLTIKIKGSIEHDQLILVCQDNGAGMLPEDLKEIKEIMNQRTNTSNHMGLYNIHRRIQIKYGQEYGVQIESELGIGTNASVILPVKYEDVKGGQSC